MFLAQLSSKYSIRLLARSTCATTSPCESEVRGARRRVPSAPASRFLWRFTRKKAGDHLYGRFCRRMMATAARVQLAEDAPAVVLSHEKQKLIGAAR